MPHYIVESIEFDFSDSMGTIPEEEQKFITENTLGLWWVDAEERFLYEPVLDPEEALIEKITEKTGWCVSSIFPSGPSRACGGSLVEARASRWRPSPSEGSSATSMPSASCSRSAAGRARCSIR